MEEKRARYEEELGRVNDMLTESENRRQLMMKEADALNKEVGPGSCHITTSIIYTRVSM